MLGDSEEEYVLDAFADGSKDQAQAELTQDYGAFEAQYQGELDKIEDALDESLYKRWDALTDPCDLHVEPYEQTNIWEIAAKGDIKVINKIFVVFGALNKEVLYLKSVSEEKFLPAFVSYGLFDDADEGQVQIQMGKMLQLLVEMEKFIDRTFTVLHNVIVQLASLYTSSSELYRTTFRLVHFQSVFEHIGRLLVMLITLDRVIEGNDTFHDHWAQYKRMTEDVKKDPGTYGVEPEKLFKLQKLLLHLEGKLLSQALYSDAVHQEFDIEGYVDARANSAFQQEFAANIANMQNELLAKLSKGDSLTNQRRYMGLSALYGLYLNLFRQPLDGRLFAAFWETHKVIPVVPLEGRSFWWPTEFLEMHCGVMLGSLKPKARQEVMKVRMDALRSRDANFGARLHQLHTRAAVWLSVMESNLSDRTNVQDKIIGRIALLRDGLNLANAIAAELRVISMLHIAMERPWAPEHVAMLCRAGGLLKAIEQTFHRRSAMIGETISAMIDQIQGALTQQFSRLRADVQSGRRQDDRKLDVLAALNFALNNVVVGPASSDRRILLRLAMSVFLRSDIGRKEELAFVQQNMSTLEVVCNIKNFIRQACDASILFWIRSVVPTFCNAVFQNPEQAYRLQYVLACLSDALPTLKRAVHTDGAKLCETFADEVQDMIQETLMEPVARDIDVELRFHVHAHLGVQKERDPFKTGVKHLVTLVRLRPLLFYNRSLDIKSFVEHHLDRLYYDEVAVTQHKWRGFEEQRNLAREKYGLNLTDALLPGQTLDNELDVLQIMRLIHVFVKTYHYNLNNQIFIQHASDGKNLNSINVNTISESIRTHGIGIMNTTVNFTFQFLKQRFITFSQFLFDDHISGRLYKDGRFFKKERSALNNMYPYERANKFNKEIRKLGMDKGQSYLDKFRVLITEIGNAMGYIRMIRAAGHHFISSAIKFVPDLQDIPAFEEAAKSAGLSDDTSHACAILDNVISNLSEHFSVGTEYFVTLVNVFAKEFRDPKNKHLKLFYLICPPLLINHIEYMVAAKDRVGKKGRAGENAVWTDDGLALGIAYILKLLDQESDHESLHFFDSCRQHFQGAIDKIRHEMAGMHKRRQAEEIQAKTATLNRLEKYLREFMLVRFAFSGCKTFFLFSDDVAQPAAAEAAEGAQEGQEGDGGDEMSDDDDDSTYQESESGADYF